MGQVYRMDADRKTLPLKRFYCTNEDKDLQQLLQNNLDLLPGDQIKVDQEQDLRWLLIKREMPATNARSGEQGLSIDFLLADQYGVPTIVECKRHVDGRARREVIAQMLEYAACGHYYWEESELLSHAETSAGGEGALKDKLGKLIGAETSPKEFFHLVKENLKSSKIRCIFFLEDSPLELRHLVQFLNDQMTDIDLLIVEARQYELQPDGERIVQPWVFGYSEKARAAKRESKAETVRTSRVKGEDAFWKAAEQAGEGGTESWVGQLRDFLSAAEKISGCEVAWGGSCMVSIPAIVPQKILFALRKEGSLELYLARWSPSPGLQLTEEQQQARDTFLAGISRIWGITLQELRDKMTYRIISHEKWLPKAEELLDLIKTITVRAPVEC
jgi:hypothetical protein